MHAVTHFTRNKAMGSKHTLCGLCNRNTTCEQNSALHRNLVVMLGVSVEKITILIISSKTLSKKIWTIRIKSDERQLFKARTIDPYSLMCLCFHMCPLAQFSQIFPGLNTLIMLWLHYSKNEMVYSVLSPATAEKIKCTYILVLVINRSCYSEALLVTTPQLKKFHGLLSV